jgi:transposase InsO family protein
MRTSGIPDEVLTDNGKQFTGRYGKPRPAEVLSERIYRKNGIKQLLTKPRSPPATGKVERWLRPCRPISWMTPGRSPRSPPPRPRSMPGARSTTRPGRNRAWWSTGPAAGACRCRS